MPRLSIALLSCALALGASAHCFKGLNLTAEEEQEMLAEAEKGSPRAAHRLWKFYSSSSEEDDKAKGKQWLIRAAELGDGSACRSLAHDIVYSKASYSKFGKTPQHAVLKLLDSTSGLTTISRHLRDGFFGNSEEHRKTILKRLTDASYKDLEVAETLADLYYSGHFGEDQKYEKARPLYLKAGQSSITAQRRLATLYHCGWGGPRNHVEAYYYMCLATKGTSVDNSWDWRYRREIEAWTILSQAEEVWRRVDQRNSPNTDELEYRKQVRKKKG